MKSFFAVVTILALSGLALSGCGMMGQNSPATDDTAHAQAQAAVADCTARYAKGEFRTFVEATVCANPRIVAAYQRAKYPYMDLVYLGVSAKLAGAVKVDAGQLTEDQFDTQVAALRARVAEEEQRRRTAHESDRTTTVPANSLLAGLPAFETAANPSPGTAGPVIAISADPTMASAAAPSEPPPPLPRPEAPEQRIAALTPPPPLPAAAAPPPADVPMARASGPGYRLQFGVFAREDNATRLTKAIGSPQTRIAVETGQDRAGHPLYYVRSGVYPDLDKAQAAAKAAQASAQSQGFKEEVSYVVLAVGDAH